MVFEKMNGGNGGFSIVAFKRSHRAIFFCLFMGYLMRSGYVERRMLHPYFSMIFGIF